MALVRERTIPTERPPPVGEVSANFVAIKYIFIWRRFLLNIEAMFLYVFTLKKQAIYSCEALLIACYTTRCSNTQYHNLNFLFSQKNKYQSSVKIVGNLNAGKNLPL
jgi:hypothetical protein